MAAWKTVQEEKKELTEAFTPLWVRALRWAATAVWGLLAGVALAVLFTFFAMVHFDRPNTSGVLVGLVLGLIALPFIVAFVALAWSLVALWLPPLRNQVVQAIGCVAVCGTVAVIIVTTNPLAARAERARLKAIAAATEVQVSPEAAARNVELERRERDLAYGPAPKEASPRYVPRVEARTADEQYENLPVIYYARRDTGIEITNNSKQQLRIAAGLGSVADPDTAPDPSPAAACSQLLGTGADSGARAASYRPGQARVLRPSAACGSKDALPVVLMVWNEEGKSTQYRLLVRQ